MILNQILVGQMLNAKYRYELESWLKQKTQSKTGFQIDLAQITADIWVRRRSADHR